MQRYSEDRVARELRVLDRVARVAFSAACAERLWPLIERYGTAASMPACAVRSLRDSLDVVWIVACGGGQDLRPVQDLSESMAPWEDDSWVTESGYVQNAVAAIAYAARSWLTDEPQEAVWAARQVYEAADYAAQHCDLDSVRIYSNDYEDVLAETLIVQEAIRAIYEDLSAARTEPAEVVRRNARDASVGFVGLFP